MDAVINELETQGFAVLPFAFSTEQTQRSFELISQTFRALESGETHTFDNFSWEYSRSNGYSQIKSPLSKADVFSTQNMHTYDPESMQKPQNSLNEAASALLASISELFHQQGLDALFQEDDQPTDTSSYWGFILNDYQPYAATFGYDVQPHRDEHREAVVLSIQLSPSPTPWKIGRDENALVDLTQEQGSMIVMDAIDSHTRPSPLHHPIIGDFHRNAIAVVLAGHYRHRFMSWMAAEKILI